jgi:anaerobic selenocysteine-containing dehydrogenase
MIQHEVDPLNGAARDAVLISVEDATRLGIAEGDGIQLTSAAGSFSGRARIDAMKPGNLEVHWPEANGLLSGGKVDPLSREPDYNAVVRVERVPSVVLST